MTYLFSTGKMSCQGKILGKTKVFDCKKTKRILSVVIMVVNF